MFGRKKLMKKIYYNIWKITGAGRQSSRFYESEKAFNTSGQKTINTYKQWGGIKAYRFTSEGWEEIKCGH